MSRIFFDTNLFIYLLEDAEALGAKVANLLGRMSARNDELLTSTLTLGEVIVKPLRLGDNSTVTAYEAMLSTPGISLISLDKTAARIYGSLRRDKSLNTADAIQLSCAAASRCDLFVTNDDRLSKRIVPGIHFISSLDSAPI